MPKLLFICTGNTCRSPMAEHLFNKIVSENTSGDWQAVSAGLSSFSGQGISNNAYDVMKEIGVETAGHVSQRISIELLEEADLILTMTSQHKGILSYNYPEYKEKIFTLKEFAGNEEDYDVMDPYGQSVEVYRKTRDEIKTQLDKILVKLNHFETNAGILEKLTNNNDRGDGMKIAIGSDHAGYDLKLEIVEHLKENGYEYKDMGTDNDSSVDYPDFGYLVASAVASGDYDRGILICGTGIGMSIAANKVDGVRAALCHDVFSAKATRNHNNSNVITLGSRVIGSGLALEIVDVWLGEEFDGGRHQRRIDKISDIEKGEC